jgi:hypothetical protein
MNDHIPAALVLFLATGLLLAAIYMSVIVPRHHYLDDRGDTLMAPVQTFGTH